MIRFLSNLGRALIVWSAIFTFLACLIGGYLLFSSILGIIIGFLTGCLVTGTFFGIIATFYEINDNLRTLINLTEDRTADASIPLDKDELRP